MKRKNTTGLITVLKYTSLLLVLGTVFVVDRSLAIGIVTSKYFWFYGSVGLLCVATMIHTIFSKKNIRFLSVDGLVILFFCSVFLTTYTLNDSFANTAKPFILALLLILYLCIRLLLDTNRQIFQHLCIFLVLTGLTEAIWGLLQLYGLLPSYHNLFNVTGSLFNPGLYAGYIAIIFPLALQCYLNNRNRQPVTMTSSINKWIGIVTCIAFFLALPATMSRASWIAVVAGSIMVIGGHLKGTALFRKHILNPEKRGLKIVAFILVAGIIIASSAGMFYLKEDSANGRLLSWKMSLSALVQRPFGVGLGHFPSAYGEAQSSYFATGSASETDVYIAGSPEYAFNDFLHIGVESGIASLLIFIGMLVCVFRGLIKCKNYGMLGAVVALLTFACFSYPLCVLPILIVFVFLLAMSTSEVAQLTYNQATKTSIIRSICVISVPMLCITVTAFCLWKQYPTYNALKQWKSNQTYYDMGLFHEAALKYAPLYPYLNGYTQFLFEYGRSLSQARQPEKSNAILQEAIKISCDPMLYNIMGRNYQALKKYDVAEQCLRKSILIVPNRIYPYYLMALMYVDMGEKEKAKQMAQIVLTKELKVQSTAAECMRNEMKKLLE